MKLSIENDVFRKIKEISSRTFVPRPAVTSRELGQELGLSHDKLMPHLVRLKYLRLLNFNDEQATVVKLTLLGCTVNR